MDNSRSDFITSEPNLLDCGVDSLNKIILDKILNGSLDKTHQSVEVGYLDSIFQKDPLASPRMKESEESQQ